MTKGWKRVVVLEYVGHGRNKYVKTPFRISSRDRYVRHAVGINLQRFNTGLSTVCGFLRLVDHIAATAPLCCYNNVEPTHMREEDDKLTFKIFQCTYFSTY
ncbi:hypothetical protein GWI33_000681 [Rhynchophorus ferrugineus]|uniref:Uncharacterized protein n=1 Tax=Rhynchophorus ferrugineus TaxID=354439 RepID=A0A834IZJ9_RHYFE|nr:hypothetical protein GWI33_000681 [Rhynchophorus ferrugineus]